MLIVTDVVIFFSAPNFIITENNTFMTSPERYVQTQLQLLVVGHSTSTTQCSDGSKDVVS